MCKFQRKVMATHPVRFNSFHSVSFPFTGSFHSYLFVSCNINFWPDVWGKGGGDAKKQHGDHVLSLFVKYLFWAFKTGWISLIFTGYNSDYVIFIVDYKFIMETSFSLDTGKFWHLATCRVFMFIMMDYMLDYVMDLWILSWHSYITVNFMENCE